MSKKIKILHLLPNLSGGGAEKISWQILTGLDQNKFSPYLLLFKDNKVSLGEAEKIKLKKLNIKIISLKKYFLFDIVNFIKIIIKIKQIKPFILHSHLGGDIYGPLASYFTKIPKIISTEHNINKSEKKIAKILKRISLKRINKIYAVSQAVKQDCISRYRIKDNKLAVIYNGVDSDYFKARDNKDKKSDTILLAAIGRLNKQKGHSTLIKACSLMKNQNFYLEIAGQGELKKQLNKQIKHLKLDNKVKLVGQVKTADYLNKVDIFIMPSLWEGLGLAVLEAAIMKKPIIASSVDGLLEILNKENSLLFPAGDSQALAKQIDYLIDNLNSQVIKEKINSAYNLVNNNFTLKEMVNKYQKVYENLAS